jgi:hypothetical protein
LFEAIKGVFDDATEYIIQKRRDWAVHRLEGKLADCLEKAEGHLSGGAKPGDAAFVSLHNTANQAIIGFSSKWDVNPSEVRTQVPGLRRLDQLITKQPEPNRLAQGSIVVSLTVLAMVLIGMLSGVAVASYHAVLHLFGW